MTADGAARSARRRIAAQRFATERELVRGAQRRSRRSRTGGSRAEGDVVSAGRPRRATPRSSPTARATPNPIPSCATTRTCPCLLCPSSFEEDPTDRFTTLAYRTAVDDYMRDEVLPYVPDAWVDYDKTKIGYEIPLTRHFYKYHPPRPLAGDRRRDQGAGG